MAIYGANNAATYSALRKSGILFGHGIAAISLEMGVRPYIDVTIRV